MLRGPGPPLRLELLQKARSSLRWVHMLHNINGLAWTLAWYGRSMKGVVSIGIASAHMFAKSTK